MNTEEAALNTKEALPQAKIEAPAEVLRNPSISQSPIPVKAPEPHIALIIPELLESILLYLDETTLLVIVQRVSKPWRDLIATSPRLQRKLFLLPNESDATVRAPRPNPLLAAAFPFCFDDIVSPPQSSRARRILWAKSNIVAAWPAIMDQRAANPLYQLPQWPRLWTHQQAFGHPRASWRRMLVHQPPAHISEVLMPTWHGQPEKWLPVPRPAGWPPALRMQDLLTSIFREFRLGMSRVDGEHEDDDDVTVISVEHSDGLESLEGDERNNVAGFKVVWRLHEPEYAQRRRAVEDVHGWDEKDDSKMLGGARRQHVLVVHDVELGSVATLDQHFEQLREILFPSWQR
ncbi:hypothetical protein PG993_007394 [Apiospora rasikravindrae]|uniref:F-box domain-containing protein n=1 Tax=Apiospora rasikravindrae TaxID=990691 RepID=A0ABR1SXE3_9PEZI